MPWPDLELLPWISVGFQMVLEGLAMHDRLQDSATGGRSEAASPKSRQKTQRAIAVTGIPTSDQYIIHGSAANPEHVRIIQYSVPQP